MKPARQILFRGMLAATVMAVAPFARAQVQTTGTPGSPSATTTIDGKQLPPPDPKFGGVIKDTAVDSKPYWPPTIVPPKGAPNVLLIMTDDQGYGVTSTFGGIIPTPAMDDKDYQPPFRFTGKLGKLTIKLEPPKRTAQEEKLLKEKTLAAKNAAQ